jgi:bifunctional DNA-binding transcriptional regulator/antitoxin component of YhaV-PrlF toxin-antitoxin module
MIVTTKIYNKYQTVVPLEIRKILGIEQNDLMEWKLKKNGKVEVSFSKNLSEKEMIGKFKAKEPFDSVKLLKKMDHGEKL